METVPPSRAVFKGDFIQPGQSRAANETERDWALESA
jgi:hypothetical protein